MLFGDIEEKDKYFSETPGYQLDWTTPATKSYEEPPDYNFLQYDNQYDKTDNRGRSLPTQDSSFLAPAVISDVMGAQPKAQTSTGPSYRERVAAYYSGQNPYQVYNEQQQQKELMAMRKQQAEREIIRQGMDAVMAGRKIPGKAQRAAYYKLLKEKQEAFGGGLEGHIDVFQKADDEEAEATAAAYDEIFQANPEWGLQKYRELSKDPKMLELVGELTAKHLKLKQEKALGEALNRAVYGGTSPTQGTPETSTAPNTPSQPGSSQRAPGQPQGYSVSSNQTGSAPLKGNAALKTQMQQMIYDEAMRQGFPPHLALGVAQAESGFNPNSVGGVGERGLFQFKLATARGLGYKGDEAGLLDPATNIRLGIAYLKQNRDRFGGDLDRAVAAHNTGPGGQAVGRPIPNANYHSSVMRYSEQYKNYRPTSQAAQSQGTDAEQKALQTNQQKLAALDAAIERVTPIVLQDSTGQSQKALQALQAQRQVVESNIKRIEDRYDKQKPTAETQRAFEKLYPGKSWHQATPEEKQQAIAQSSTIAASEAGERAGAVAQAELGPKKEAAKASYEAKRVDQPHMYRGAKGEKMPGGMTLEQMSKMDEEYARENPGQVYWTRLEKLNDKERSDIRERTIFVDRLQEIADKVDKVITGPVAGRLERLKRVWGIDVNDEKIGMQQLLQQVINDKAFAQGGKTLPAAELDRILATLPKDIDNPEVFRASVNSALKLAHQYHQMHISGLEEDGFTGLNTYRRGTPRYAEKKAEVPQEQAPSLDTPMQDSLGTKSSSPSPGKGKMLADKLRQQAN